MQSQQRRNKGFPQTDNIGDKHAAIGFKHLLRGKNGVLLIAQLPEIRWQVFRTQPGTVAQIVTEVFRQKFQIEFIRREKCKRRLVFHCLNNRFMHLPDIHSIRPEFIKPVQSVVMIFRFVEQDIKFQIALQTAV